MAQGAWHWRQVWQSTAHQLADLLFPPECAFCHDDLPAGTGQMICARCRDGFLADRATRRCHRCGAPTPVPTDSRDRCYACRTTAFRFGSVTPLGDYRNALKQAVLLMKKWQRDPLSLAIGSLAAVALSEPLRGLDVDRVVPVPMHWLRRLWRSTNSPDLLAEAIARQLQVPDDARCLVRTRRTEQQSILAPSRRVENVRQLFRVRGSRELQNQTILLVDDILTTGATANDASRALLEAGAKAVHVCVIARAAPP